MGSIGEEYVGGIYWVEARGAAKCPGIHRPTRSPHQELSSLQCQECPRLRNHEKERKVKLTFKTITMWS